MDCSTVLGQSTIFKWNDPKLEEENLRGFKSSSLKNKQTKTVSWVPSALQRVLFSGCLLYTFPCPPINTFLQLRILSVAFEIFLMLLVELKIFLGFSSLTWSRPLGCLIPRLLDSVRRITLVLLWF